MKNLLSIAIIRLLALLPFTWGQWLGVMLGHIVYWMPNRAKQETQTNIKRCLPDLNPQQQSKLVKQSLIHTGMMFMETGHNFCGTPKQKMARIVNVQGQSLLDTPQSRIILTPHLGNWELFAAWLAQNTPLTALYKPAKLAKVDTLIARGRNAAGMAIAPTNKNGIMALKRTLKKSQSILILPDQEPHPHDGIQTHFFNQPAYTMTLACKLAQPRAPHLPVQVLLGWARRCDLGKGFAIELTDISAACHQGELSLNVAGMNQAIERLIRQHPEQYHWEYRRFKHTLDKLS